MRVQVLFWNMNNSNAGGVFDIELQDVESSGAAPLEQSDDDSIELDEVGGKKNVV